MYTLLLIVVLTCTLDIACHHPVNRQNLYTLMKEARQAYIELQTNLTLLVQALPYHLESEQTELISTLNEILTNMKENLNDWDDEDVFEFETKWTYLQLWMDSILEKINDLVKKSSTDWYSLAKNQINWNLFTLVTSLEKMKPFKDPSFSRTPVAAPGPGGANPYGESEQGKHTNRERINNAVDVLLKTIYSKMP